MLIIYCAKDKQKQAVKQLDPEGPYLFLSPQEDTVNHTATHVVVVGNHQHIADRYKGIAKVELIELQPVEDEQDEEPEPTEEPE